MRSKHPHWAANIGLLIISLALSLFVGEAIVRFLNLVHVDEGLLMFSSQTFQIDQNGAVRYLPNKNIRTLVLASAIDRAVIVELRGESVPFAMAEDLIVHKLFAGRPIDLEDAAAVVRRKGPDLDWRYVEKWIGVRKK